MLLLLVSVSFAKQRNYSKTMRRKRINLYTYVWDHLLSILRLLREWIQLMMNKLLPLQNKNNGTQISFTVNLDSIRCSGMDYWLFSRYSTPQWNSWTSWIVPRKICITERIARMTFVYHRWQPTTRNQEKLSPMAGGIT